MPRAPSSRRRTPRPSTRAVAGVGEEAPGDALAVVREGAEELGGFPAGEASSSRRRTPRPPTRAVVEVGGGAPGAALAVAREGAGELGGSPAGVPASVGGVEQSWATAASRRRRLASRPRAVALTFGEAGCLLLLQWVGAWVSYR